MSGILLYFIFVAVRFEVSTAAGSTSNVPSVLYADSAHFCYLYCQTKVTCVYFTYVNKYCMFYYGYNINDWGNALVDPNLVVRNVYVPGMSADGFFNCSLYSKTNTCYCIAPNSIATLNEDTSLCTAYGMKLPTIDDLGKYLFVGNFTNQVFQELRGRIFWLAATLVSGNSTVSDKYIWTYTGEEVSILGTEGWCRERDPDTGFCLVLRRPANETALCWDSIKCQRRRPRVSCEFQL